MATKLTHSRWDDSVCHTPGLFKSLSPGERDGKLDVKHKYSNKAGVNVELHFVGPEALGVDDLRVFQALIATAAVCCSGGHGDFLAATTLSISGRVLRDGLEEGQGERPGFPDAPADFDDAAMVLTSYADLAQAIGYKNSREQSSIRASIQRLMSTTIFSTYGNQTKRSQLISSDYSNDAAKQICIAINPKMARAIIGDGHFVTVSLTEARLLVTPAARLIHHRLSWLGHGKSSDVGLDTLCGYAWPTPSAGETKRRENAVALQLKERSDKLLSEIAQSPDAATCAATQKKLDVTQVAEATDPKKAAKRRASKLLSKHRTGARVALSELVAVGWSIMEKGRSGMFTIKRPPMPMNAVASAAH